MGKFSIVSRNARIEELSFGLVAGMLDLALLSLFLGLSLVTPSKHAGKMWQKIFFRLQTTLHEADFKTVFYRLKQEGLIDYSKRIWQNPQITAAGENRLRKLLPVYDEKRVWDKRLYLISYDVPNERKTIRDSLRQTLKRLGCGLLQESVWLTPYNPKKVLEEFVIENELSGQVLISDLGKDGSVGEEDLRSLVSRVYALEKINQRYREFLDELQDNKFSPERLALFFSILKDDPQLPFELLPDDWLGENAWEKVKPMFFFGSSVGKT